MPIPNVLPFNTNADKFSTFGETTFCRLLSGLVKFQCKKLFRPPYFFAPHLSSCHAGLLLIPGQLAFFSPTSSTNGGTIVGIKPRQFANTRLLCSNQLNIDLQQSKNVGSHTFFLHAASSWLVQKEDEGNEDDCDELSAAPQLLRCAPSKLSIKWVFRQ
jgi:hypothetical protein